MRWLSRLRRRARLVVDRSAIEREMQEEMRFHLEMEAAELARLGNEDAWRAARRRFGGVARYQDDARDARGGRWLEELRQDARYALRVLGRGRGFAAVSVLTLALGVGANTAIFSVVRGVLLRQLPYADAERLVAIASVIRGSATAVSPPDFLDWRAQGKSFSAIAAHFAVNGRLPPGSGPLVVCSTNAWFQPEQAERVKKALAGGGVLCAVRSPYDAALVPNVPALLSYGDVPASLEALATVLAGKRQAEGRLPVQLP